VPVFHPALDLKAVSRHTRYFGDTRVKDKGAHYHRADLQVHTPRDTNWIGAECVTDEEREKYAKSLVSACRERGLQAIAVTDHHDMAFVPYIRRAAKEETDAEGTPIPDDQQLVVFPGMELTLGVPCQALLIFDADFPDDLFGLAMNALAITPSSDGDSRIAPVQRLRIDSLLELRDQLDRHAFLKGRYIIFPHVGESGNFSLLRKGLAHKYVEMHCVGGYLDGSPDKLGNGNKGIIAGKNKEWGNKRIACFQTSDNRSDDHKDLGKHSTWIKWAVPTAEALRQACLAQESRVCLEQPVLPSIVIGGISVSNSVFLGPIDLEINPQYTALIGGRGTGKSTILEYLRWALCDQPPTVGDEDTPNYQARRSRLIDQTLKPVKATVQVRFEVNGVPHLIRRNSLDGSLLIKIAQDELRSCTEEEVRTLLPIQAYSQKQLSDISVRVDELSRFITAPIRSELADTERKTADSAERVRQSFAARRRQRMLAQVLEKRELEQRSLEGQAEAIRGGLTGLSDDDRALLERGKLFDAADRQVRSWQDGGAGFAAEATKLLAKVNSCIAELDAPPDEPEGAILSAAHAQYSALLDDAKKTLSELAARAESMTISASGDAEGTPWQQWSGKIAEFRSSYDAAAQRSSDYSERLKQLQAIEDQLSRHLRETARVREELRAISDADAIYQSQRSAWEACLVQFDDHQETQCAVLTESSGGTIRASVRRNADATNFVDTLRQILSGSRVQSSRIEKLGESIMTADDAGVQWRAILEDLEKLAEFDCEREASERRPDSPLLTEAGLTPGDLERIARNLKPDDWLRLSLVRVISVPVFEYRAREGEYIPFQNASAGQQATALLKTLLNQAGPPLIVDQPEEDLDNPVMLEIVQQMWQAKQKRQIVFASHNANLVVNGDAELVAWCEYRTTSDESRGMIAGQGAIDVPEVREAIKRIMEGGEAAFKLRREKYGF
jgi:chromosome segregation protein